MVLFDFLKCIFYSLFYLCEGWLLGCKTKVVCIDETLRSRVGMLVVCVYVKQYLFLFPPSVTFVVQLDIESPT